MATLSTALPTLADLAQEMHNNILVDTAEVLAETNEIYNYMGWTEGNDGAGHKVNVRTGYPAGTWRLLNNGVPAEKGTSVMIREAAGSLESYAEADKRLAELSGNVARYRMKRATEHIIGLGETFISTLFYGDASVDPEKPTGLAPRFSSTTAENGVDNLILGGGSGSDNLSVWLIGFGERSFHGFYAQGGSAGLQREDLGQDTKVDSSGNMHEVYREHFIWEAGFAMPDWRDTVRIANVDVSNLTKDAAGSSADLVDLMIQATEIVPKTPGVRYVWAMNRTARSFLRRQKLNFGNTNVEFDTVEGKRTMFFDEYPIARCDALLNTEATVS